MLEEQYSRSRQGDGRNSERPKTRDVYVCPDDDQLQCPDYNRLKSASAGRSNKTASNRGRYSPPDDCRLGRRNCLNRRNYGRTNSGGDYA